MEGMRVSNSFPTYTNLSHCAALHTYTIFYNVNKTKRNVNMPVMPNSCGRVLNVSKRQGMGRGGVPVRVPMGPVYYIVTKIFRC